jgi:purine-binding chemotaxis protein CheW
MNHAAAELFPDGEELAHGTEYVTVTAGGQLFGLPIGRVRDVFMVDGLTPVPLAPPEIVGLLNLRGRVATAIDLKRRLGLCRAEGQGLMAVGIEAHGESYGLIVEGIGDVVRLGNEMHDGNPADLSGSWSGLSAGVHRMGDQLLVILDVDALLAIGA